MSMVAVLLATGCERKEEKKPETIEPSAASLEAAAAFAPLKAENQTLKLTKPACAGEDCATLDASWPLFAQETALSALVERQLITLAGSQLATMPAFAQAYLKGAESRWSITLLAKLLRQEKHYAVISLDVYDFTGGAHGNPSNQLLNYDRAQQRQLRLNDILLAGQQAAFEQQARLAHERWALPFLKEDAGYLQSWPFQPTDNFMLAKQGLVLKYQAYAIAPYSSGQPDILIPYEKLAGIIKPEWVLQ